MLLVIDMQTDFSSTATPVVDACLREIKQAKRNKEYIIQVEYKNCGWTHLKLAKELDSYERRLIVVKSRNGGGSEIAAALRKAKLRVPPLFRVCGVNTDYCVRETVEGLVGIFPKTPIELLAHACNGHDHKYGLKLLSQVHNVTIRK